MGRRRGAKAERVLGLDQIIDILDGVQQRMQLRPRCGHHPRFTIDRRQGGDGGRPVVGVLLHLDCPCWLRDPGLHSCSFSVWVGGCSLGPSPIGSILWDSLGFCLVVKMKSKRLYGMNGDEVYCSRLLSDWVCGCLISAVNQSATAPGCRCSIRFVAWVCYLLLVDGRNPGQVPWVGAWVA